MAPTPSICTTPQHANMAAAAAAHGGSGSRDQCTQMSVHNDRTRAGEDTERQSERDTPALLPSLYNSAVNALHSSLHTGAKTGHDGRLHDSNMRAGVDTSDVMNTSGNRSGLSTSTAKSGAAGGGTGEGGGEGEEGTSLPYGGNEILNSGVGVGGGAGGGGIYTNMNAGAKRSSLLEAAVFHTHLPKVFVCAVFATRKWVQEWVWV